MISILLIRKTPYLIKIIIPGYRITMATYGIIILIEPPYLAPHYKNYIMNIIPGLILI